MADLKISQLTALTSIDAVGADVLPVVDSSAATTKKISLADVSEFVINDIVFPVASQDLDDLVGKTLTLNAQTGTTYTIVIGDNAKVVTLNNASAITLTVPTNSVAVFDVGSQVNLVQLGAGQVTVGGAGVTLRSQGSKFKLNGQYSAATLLKIGTDEWVLVGNTAA